MSDYPELKPWQEKVLKQFQGKGALHIIGRQNGKSWSNLAMQRLMDDLVNRPIEELKCDTGTVFGKRYYTVEPIGGNWLEMEEWCKDTYGKATSVWDTMKEPVTLGRWYMNDRKFWFLDKKDREWFILRWS